MTMTIFAARSHHPRSQKSQPIPTQETPLPGTTSFQLLLTLLSGTTKVIDVNPTHTIRALKWKIKDVIGIYPTKFRITIDGRPLATDAEELQSIKDHGITAEATVRIQLYILGGGKKGAKPLKHHVIYHGKVNGKKDGEDLYGVYPDTDWMRDIKVTQDGVPSSRAVGYDTLEEAEAEWRTALLANPATNPKGHLWTDLIKADKRILGLEALGIEVPAWARDQADRARRPVGGIRSTTPSPALAQATPSSPMIPAGPPTGAAGVAYHAPPLHGHSPVTFGGAAGGAGVSSHAPPL